MAPVDDSRTARAVGHQPNIVAKHIYGATAAIPPKTHVGQIGKGSPSSRLDPGDQSGRQGGRCRATVAELTECRCWTWPRRACSPPSSSQPVRRAGLFSARSRHARRPSSRRELDLRLVTAHVRVAAHVCAALLRGGYLIHWDANKLHRSQRWGLGVLDRRRR
jgi:hypothetical protein